MPKSGGGLWREIEIKENSQTMVPGSRVTKIIANLDSDSKDGREANFSTGIFLCRASLSHPCHSDRLFQFSNLGEPSFCLKTHYNC